MAKILIVDDSSVSRKKLKTILETENHIIVGEAGDGNEALKKFKELNPDLVTMDITMPNMNGIETLKKIIEIAPKAKVIMITALGQGSKILEALNSGATNYITKPFEEENVLRSIEDALNEA